MMQPHLFTFVLTLVFNTLLLTPITASHLEIFKRSPKTSQGYRCGQRVFRLELLEAVTTEAEKIIRQSNYGSLPIDSTYPRMYVGPLQFTEDSSILWMWPFSMIAQSSSEAEAYYLILGTGLGIGPAKIVGVIRQKDTQVKCIKELNLSDMIDSNFAFGYRCPLSVYSFETISKAVQKAKKAHLDRSTSSVESKYPSYFLGSTTFEEEEVAWSWPLSHGGISKNRVAISIIMNQQFELLGVIYEKTGYQRCILTVHHRVNPKFIGPPFEKSVGDAIFENVDAFKCNDENMIMSSQVLYAASDIPRKLAEKKFVRSSWYPLPYEFPSSGTPQKLYRWPLRLDNSGRYQPFSRFKLGEKLFVVIDDFLDVYGVIINLQGGTFMDCPRENVPRTIFLKSFRHQRSES